LQHLPVDFLPEVRHLPHHLEASGLVGLKRPPVRLPGISATSNRSDDA
jgi:hypothetical protein